MYPSGNYAGSIGQQEVIGGLFDDIGKVISKGATAVVKTAQKIPVVSNVAQLAASPFTVTANILKGKNVSKTVWNQLKRDVSNARAVAPYAQAVVSLVPGVGTGVAGAIGAAAALSEGKTIDNALLAGVRGALPGGPAAKAAFDIGTAMIAGKSPQDAVVAGALNQIPGTPQQKAAMLQGAKLVADIAAGKNVAQATADRALALAPPQAKKALQTGLALAQAAKLQSLAKKPAVKKGLLIAAHKTMVKKAMAKMPVKRAPYGRTTAAPTLGVRGIVIDQKRKMQKGVFQKANIRGPVSRVVLANGRIIPGVFRKVG